METYLSIAIMVHQRKHLPPAYVAPNLALELVHEGALWKGLQLIYSDEAVPVLVYIKEQLAQTMLLKLVLLERNQEGDYTRLELRAPWEVPEVRPDLTQVMILIWII